MKTSKETKEMIKKFNKIEPKLVRKYICKHCKTKLYRRSEIGWIIKIGEKEKFANISVKCHKCKRILIIPVKELQEGLFEKK